MNRSPLPSPIYMYGISQHQCIPFLFPVPPVCVIAYWFIFSRTACHWLIKQFSNERERTVLCFNGKYGMCCYSKILRTTTRKPMNLFCWFHIQQPWLKLIEIMAESLDLFEDYDSSFEFEGFTAEELGEDRPRLDESLDSDIEVESRNTPNWRCTFSRLNFWDQWRNLKLNSGCILYQGLFRKP